MNAKKVGLIGLGIALIGAASVASLRRAGNEGAAVELEAVVRRDLVQKVSGTGRVRPVSEVSISANVAGRIVALPIRSGGRVQEGDLLVELDPARYQAAVAQARAAHASALTQVDLAHANLKQAEADLKRARDLAAKKLIAPAELESAETAREIRAANLRAAGNDVNRASAAVDQAQDDLSKTVIMAPRAGTVTELRKEVGEIAMGADFQEDVILVLAELTQMETRFDVDENDIVNVTLGDSVRVEVDAFPDTAFGGRVREIATSARSRGMGTQESGTVFEVRADLVGQHEGLRPGMSATVDVFTEKSADALAIPIQAVTARSGEKIRGWLEEPDPGEESTADDDLVEIAFVVEEGAAKVRRVRTGISDDIRIEILDGLEEGEEVIIGPYRALSSDLAHEDQVLERETEEESE